MKCRRGWTCRIKEFKVVKVVKVGKVGKVGKVVKDVKVVKVVNAFRSPPRWRLSQSVGGRAGARPSRCGREKRGRNGRDSRLAADRFHI